MMNNKIRKERERKTGNVESIIKGLIKAKCINAKLEKIRQEGEE